jgi:uncharacterized protein (DUF1330 family)
MGWQHGKIVMAALVLATTACTDARPQIAAPTAAAPPKGYLVAEIAVTDMDSYRRYAAAAGPVIAACGGRYLARGGRVEGLEGPPPEARFVIVEFASFDAARACYQSSAYQAVAPIRRAASRSRFWLSEGLPQ